MVKNNRKLKDMTEYDENTLGAKEFCKFMGQNKSTIIFQRAFRADPGNSVVYAMPKAPGLRIGDLLDSSLKNRTK